MNMEDGCIDMNICIIKTTTIINDDDDRQWLQYNDDEYNLQHMYTNDVSKISHQ